MGKGISISVASDTREFVSGVRKGVIDPLEDAQKAIEKVGKTGDKAGSQLEDSMRDAQRATSKLEQDQKDLSQTMERGARTGGKSWSKATKESADESGRAIHEFGDEAKQNIGETFSSFRGDITDFGQIAQDTLGGLTSGLEGIGPVAAVAAGAAGIGLIMGALTQAGEDSELFKQRVSDLAGELIDAGSTGERSIDQIVDALKTLATTGDDAGVTLSKLNDLSSKSGSDFTSIAHAYTGTTDALKKQWRAQKDVIDGLKEKQQEEKTDILAARIAATQTQQQIAAASELQGYLGQQIAITKEAAKEQELYAKSGGPELEHKAQLISNLNDAYDNAAGAASEFYDEDSKIFDTSKYIEKMQEKEAALREYQQNLLDFGGQLGPEATGYLESLGEDQASILLGAYKNASTTQQAELARIWAAAGSQNSGDYMSNLKAGIPATMDGPTIKTSVDNSAYEQFKRNFGNPAFHIPIILDKPAGMRVP